MALALTGRRRAAAAAVSVLAAVVLAAGVAGRGCRVRPPGPDAAVRNMLAAVEAGDREAVYALLSPDTQAGLEERARRATDLVGSNVRYTALDLISIDGEEGEDRGRVAIDVVAQDDHRATVEIVSSAGRARLELVKVDGRWRIDLPSVAAAP